MELESLSGVRNHNWEIISSSQKLFLLLNVWILTYKQKTPLYQVLESKLRVLTGLQPRKTSLAFFSSMFYSNNELSQPMSRIETGRGSNNLKIRRWLHTVACIYMQMRNASYLIYQVRHVLYRQAVITGKEMGAGRNLSHWIIKSADYPNPKHWLFSITELDY